MPNYQDLQAQIASLQAQAEEMRQQEIAEVIQEIKEKIALYTLKAEDLGFRPMQRARSKETAIGCKISKFENRRDLERARQSAKMDFGQAKGEVPDFSVNDFSSQVRA